MKKNIKYILLALVIVMAFGITFYKNLAYSYETQGDAYNILETAYVGCSGYEVVQGQYEEGTTTFTVVADDPQFYLSGTGRQHSIGGIEIVLAKPFSQNTPIPVQRTIRTSAAYLWISICSRVTSRATFQSVRLQ